MTPEPTVLSYVACT